MLHQTRKLGMPFLECQINSRSHTMGLQKKRDRRRMEIQKEIWKERKKGMEKLIKYVKKIGFYQEI
jgi:hypothetical protein